MALRRGDLLVRCKFACIIMAEGCTKALDASEGWVWTLNMYPCFGYSLLIAYTCVRGGRAGRAVCTGSSSSCPFLSSSAQRQQLLYRMGFWESLLYCTMCFHCKAELYVAVNDGSGYVTFKNVSDDDWCTDNWFFMICTFFFFFCLQFVLNTFSLCWTWLLFIHFKLFHIAQGL